MINFLHGDCRDILPLDRHCDVLITDPVWPNPLPELIGSDDPDGLFRDMWSHLGKLPTRAAIILGCNSDPRMLRHVPLPFFRCCWLRYKVPSYKGRLLHSGDVAYLYGEPPKIIPGRRVIPGEFVSTRKNFNRGKHPCPRPVDSMEWLVGIWTDVGEHVVDPFAGIGTTGMACNRWGRDCTLIEICSEFLNTSKRLINQEALFEI